MFEMDKKTMKRITGFIIDVRMLQDIDGITRIELHDGNRITIEGLTTDNIEVTYNIFRERAKEIGLLKEMTE
ncbi:hypothetical protein BHK98_12575 [Hornefia porci]|uniref:Uncharacterized protein n=1 Tax=Hornefia porci TaxID=2652292 RepID=A0A1Q9JL06_9FIRM|nr:hypothetical protein [Hornefia porci]OLR56825.1 hypothetical protein BHK98_12575 [Hornefia porci]